MATQIQVRRGTASDWALSNPVLAQGEIGFVVDENKFKVGNGTSNWSSLPYLQADAYIDSVILGTDTTGNYVADLTAGTGISVSGGGTETANITVTNTGVTSISGTANEVDVSASTGSITISLPATINADTTGNADTATNADKLDNQDGSYYLDWTNTTNKPDPTITLGGDLSGSITLTDLVGGTLTATIEANSVELGADTTGNYVASVSASDGISSSGTGEGASVSLTNTDKGSSQNIFKNVTVGANTIIADNNDDTLTLDAGTGIAISANTTTDTVTISNNGVTEIAGTSNQISVSSSTGSTTLSLPNDVVFPGTVTLNANPTQALQAVTKQYVDAIAEGLHVHASVSTATTANIADLSDPPASIDGVTLTDTMRVLVKNQTTTSQNGIYVYDLATTALVRASDFNTSSEIQGGDFLFVTGGNTYENTGWVQTETVTTVGTDPIIFTQFSGAGTYSAGTGLELNGTVFSNTGVLSLTGTTDEINVSSSSGNVTISLPNTISADISGNAATVTNGVYTSGSYSDPSWLTISKSRVGLGNVENTALSTWSGSSNITTLGTISTGTWNGSTISATYIDSDIARLSSPTFTGTPVAPTADPETNTTQIATTAFVQNAVDSVLPSGSITSYDDAVLMSGFGTPYWQRVRTVYDPSDNPLIDASYGSAILGGSYNDGILVEYGGTTYFRSQTYFQDYVDLGSLATATTQAASTNNTSLATTEFVQTAVNTVTINLQTSSYVLSQTDAGKVIEMNVASANNLTVPPSGTVNFPIGTSIDIVQYGAGQTTVVAGSGVTIRSTGGKLKLSGQYSGATLYKRGTDEWVCFGDLSA